MVKIGELFWDDALILDEARVVVMGIGGYWGVLTRMAKLRFHDVVECLSWRGYLWPVLVAHQQL